MLGQGQNVTYRFSRYRAAPRYRTSGFFYPLLIMKLKDIQNGWMKIPTKWYRETSIKACREHAMLQWLVMNANITESEWNGITIKRGQVVTSLSKLSEGVQQSTQQTRDTLNNIVSNKEVTKIATKTYTIITICNFDDYVGLNFYDNKEENKEATQSATQSATKKQHSQQQQIRDIVENKDIEITSRTDVLEEAEIVTESINNPGRDYKRARARKKPETPNEVTWRDSFDVYLQDCRDAWKRWTNDRDWMDERKRFNPGVDIRLTLEKACKEFWATEAGWLHKKKGRSKTIDWKRIFEFAISQKQNRVYETKAGNNRGTGGLTDEERAMFEHIAFGTTLSGRGDEDM